MAGQGPNQILDLLRALRRRRYQIVVPALLIATLGIALAVIVPKRYRLSMRIEIKDYRIETDYQLRNRQESAVRREAQAVFEHVVNFQRVKEVIKSNRTQWPEYVQLSESDGDQFILQKVMRNLSAQTTTKDPKAGTTLFVDISYVDEDATRAARLLDNLSKQWLTEALESDKNTFTTEKAQLQKIKDDQETDLQKTQTRLYTLLEQLGIDPSAKSSDRRRDDSGDIAFVMLDDKKKSLDEVEFKLKTAEFELAQARQRLAEEPPKLQRKVELEAEAPGDKLERLKDLLTALEDQIANLRPSNSAYGRLDAKIQQTKTEIAEIENQEPEENVRWVEEDNPRLAEYELAVRTKEDEVGRLKRQQEVLTEDKALAEREASSRVGLYREVEDLRTEVAVKTAALNETRSQWIERDKSLEMLNSSPDPWRIARPPLPSSATTEPNPLLLSAVAVFLGLAAGLGLALGSEYARSCYRSAGDLAGVMTVPVLGAIETIVTRRERRRLQLSHAVAGLSTAVIVGTIGWVTWLWYSSPDRLPFEVQDAIERLRSALK